MPPFKRFLLPFFRSLKGLDEFVLVSEQERLTGVKREYRAGHGAKAVTWGFDLDKDGKIMACGPR